MGRDHERPPLAVTRRASSSRPLSAPSRRVPSRARRAAGARDRGRSFARPRPSGASLRSSPDALVGDVRERDLFERSLDSVVRVPRRSANRWRFSRAVSSSYRRVRWVSSSHLQRICSRLRARSNPRTDPPPYVGDSEVATIRSSVLLPAPFGPRRTTASPRSIERSTRTTAGAAPNSLVTPRRSTAASRTPTGGWGRVRIGSLLYHRARSVHRPLDTLAEHQGPERAGACDARLPSVARVMRRAFALLGLSATFAVAWTALLPSRSSRPSPGPARPRSTASTSPTVTMIREAPSRCSRGRRSRWQARRKLGYTLSLHRACGRWRDPGRQRDHLRGRAVVDGRPGPRSRRRPSVCSR